MKIKAAQVKDLRDQTGAGFMDCKKALVEADGDSAAALEILQRKGADRTANRSERPTSEGVIAIYEGCIAEVLCETDFVARNEAFIKFSEDVAWYAFVEGRKYLKDLDKDLQKISALTGENIRIGRVASSVLIPRGSYLHSNKQIGAIVWVEKSENDVEVARNVAMHVVASNPAYLDASYIPEHLLEKQEDLFRAQAEEMGKPAHVLDRIVQGKLKKWETGICLLTQPYVKDPDMTVGEYAKKAKTTVTNFWRLQVGS